MNSYLLAGVMSTQWANCMCDDCFKTHNLIQEEIKTTKFFFVWHSSSENRARLKTFRESSGSKKMTSSSANCLFERFSLAWLIICDTDVTEPKSIELRSFYSKLHEVARIFSDDRNQSFTQLRATKNLTVRLFVISMNCLLIRTWSPKLSRIDFCET